MNHDLSLYKEGIVISNRRDFMAKFVHVTLIHPKLTLQMLNKIRNKPQRKFLILFDTHVILTLDQKTIESLKKLNIDVIQTIPTFRLFKKIPIIKDNNIDVFKPDDELYNIYLLDKKFP